MKRLKLLKKRWLILLGVILLAAVALPTILVITLEGDIKKSEDASKQTEETTERKTDENKHEAEQKPAENPQPSQQSQNPPDQHVVYPVTLTHEQAASLTAVVNKKYKLPSDYTPSLVYVSNGQLRPEAASALGSLLDGASNAGFSLKIISAYRSYANQQSTYNGWVAQYGQAEADTFSARPGHSEHQTGLAVDLGLANDSSYDLEQGFGATPAGQWIAANAHNYGFIIRYPEGKDGETGYHYEPWHLRYLGVEVAQAVVASSKTLDQYYGIPAGGY